MKKLEFARVTGAVAISYTLYPLDPFEFIGYKLHLSAAPTTSENFTITADANAGVAYDINIVTKDMSLSGGLADRIEIFDKPIPMDAQDKIVAAWANTDLRTYGLELIFRRL